MKKLLKLMFCLALLSWAVPMGFSRGDKVIPQVVNGPGWKTNFDLTNISSDVTISNMWLRFYRNDGSNWSLQTSLGTGYNFQLLLLPKQTLRVETSGTGQLAAGYAVIYDEEPGNSEYSEDYVLGISAFYVYSENSRAVDTVTVSVPQPTAAAAAPVQINADNGIYSGFAFVNRAGAANKITVTLYRDNGNLYGEASFTLQAGNQRAEFLHENLFPGLAGQNFRGMAEITASGPIALLGLLQTRAANGQQYATLVPVDRESLRRNTNIVLLQASDDTDPFMPLDIDGFTVDYFRTTDLTEAYSWDIEYRYNAPDSESRYVEAFNNASIASIGFKNNADFDNITLPQLKDLNYQQNGQINLSGSSLYVGFTFAVHTDIGNYAKLRVVRIIDTADGSFQNKDLVLEVCLYK
jgi:hypothetical protein